MIALAPIVFTALIINLSITLPVTGSNPEVGSSNNNIKTLEKLYPNMKQDELELLATMYTTKEIKEIVEQTNI